ncbi:MAG: A/G-specific adenine glycosylase [Porticoccaceae bacterium]
MKTFAQRLLSWFDVHGRKDLPWQHDITPYRVWLSEIMLQQTQVNTVIPYFERFTAAFPDVHALATASIDQVLHLWTGLGYYARARNLHRSAEILVDCHGGEFPPRIEALMELPGIGRSTAGAILAIALQQRASILDGNAKRVLARHGAIAGWPGQTGISNTLWQLAEDYTPHERIADYTQAIMDLGATLCTRARPACPHCPLRDDCAALKASNPLDYPGKKPKAALPIRQILLLILNDAAGRVLLVRRPPTGVWGGLWSFPECRSSDEIIAVCEQVGCVPCLLRVDTPRRHTFSHYHLDYTPVHINVDTSELRRVAEVSDVCWISPHQPGVLGLPKPITTLLAEYGAVAQAFR